MPDTRIGVSRRDLIIGGVLAGTAAVTYARLPRTPVTALPDGVFADVIPKQVGAWREVENPGFVMPPEDEQAAAAVYEDQLTRSYARADEPPIMLLIAYDRSQSGMLMIHRPESCYPGSGFAIRDTRPTAVPLAPGLAANARFLTAERLPRIEQVLYWTRLGNGFPRDWDEQREEIALQNLRGLVPDGALVRLSMIEADAGRALASMRQFAATLFQASGRDGRALLAGPLNASARSA